MKVMECTDSWTPEYLDIEVVVHAHGGEADHTPHCVGSVGPSESGKARGGHAHHEGLVCVHLVYEKEEG